MSSLPLARRSAALVALVALVFVACGPPQFDVPVEADATIDGAGLLSALVPPAFGGFNGLDLSQTAAFQNQGITKDQVSSVVLKSLVLNITAPTGANFDFLESITFSVETAGQPKKVLAKAISVPKGQGTLVLDLEALELVPYVTAEQMSLTTSATGRPPADDTTVHAVAVFGVVPKLF